MVINAISQHAASQSAIDITDSLRQHRARAFVLTRRGRKARRARTRTVRQRQAPQRHRPARDAARSSATSALSLSFSSMRSSTLALSGPDPLSCITRIISRNPAS